MWQIIGHERAVRLLQNSIDTNRVSHAYLLSGPRQIGKFTLAREFAKALNCLQPDSPCGQCRSCRKIDGSAHPDVQAVELQDGARNISIDAIRGLQNGVALKPYEGRTKVYLLGDVEGLSEPAANSLLKTLEEPPPSVVLILTTLDATLLLPTVVSRCQQIYMRPVPEALVEDALRQVSGMAPDRARLVAALAGGRVGWALQAASNPAVLDKRAELLERLTALQRADRTTRFSYAAELAAIYARDQETARGALETWQGWWRDLLLSRLGLSELATNVDFRDRAAADARRYSIESIGRMVQCIQRTLNLLAQNVNARLALDVLMLSVPQPSR